MVKISAFNGVTYNKDQLNLDKTIFAPPYDVIGPEYQETLYSRSPYNIVRLILGKMYASDNENNNRYSRAAKDYQAWLNEGILIKSYLPKIYFYVQHYTDGSGELVVRKGLIARGRLENFENKVVLPHEETMGGPKEDRFKLMQAASANFSQIFCIYSDPESCVDKELEKICVEKPLIDIIDDENVRHIFYEISDEDIINKVTDLMAEKQVLIADGHHRYETALRYRDEKRKENKDPEDADKSYDYVMMYFANLDDVGLRVYPTHRILKKNLEIDFGDLYEHLKLCFDIEEKPLKLLEDSFAIMKTKSAKDLWIGILTQARPDILYLLTPKSEHLKAKMAQLNVPETLVELDVTILHKLILEDVLGFDTLTLKNQNNIEFVRDEVNLAKMFKTGEAGTVFLVSAPELSKVKEICMSGYRMPQKTTYFYPKLLSGLVINPLS